MEYRSFKTVFGKIDISEKIKNIFEPAFVKKVAVSKNNSIMKIELFSERFIEISDISKLERELEAHFVDAENIEIKVRFSLEKEAESFLKLAKHDICDKLTIKRPILSAMLESAKWSIEDDVLTIELRGGSSFLMKQSFVDKKIKEIFSESYGLSVGVEFLDVGGQPQAIKNAGHTEHVPTAPRKETLQARSAGKKAPVAGEKSKQGAVLWGKGIKGSVTQISSAKTVGERIVVDGNILSLDKREIKGEKLLIKMDITDYTDSTTVILFAKKDKFSEVSKYFEKGKRLRIEGDIQYDKYSSEINIAAKSIERLEPLPEKMDDATQKRVELHLHTQMSQMDGMTNAKTLIERAAKWGHKAVAITDHGGVQAFPDAMEASKKYGIKILYGMEGYLVSDIGSVVQSPKNQTLYDEFVVFDIETTGLKKEHDRITEIGAVKIRNGNVVDEFSTFVDPGRPIPPKIQELTGITDEMVKNAPGQKSAVKSFLEFAGEAVLVAHNAEFDMGFIAHQAARKNIVVENTVLDTLGLSRAVFQDLPRHKLDNVAAHLGISLKNHHRAVDDSRATAEILLRIFEILRRNGVKTVSDINLFASENTNFKKMRTSHVIIIAKNKKGLKSLYELVSESSINFFFKRPRILKSILHKNRDGLIIGSACGSGELFRAILDKKPDSVIKEIANFYDYLEIQPLGVNQFLLDEGTVSSKDDLIDINKKIIALGEELGKPVVATCDVHFIDPEDEIYRRIIMKGEGYADADRQPPLYFRTTAEMLEEFSYLTPEKAKEVVIDNTNAVADMVDTFTPIPEGTYPPEIEGADEKLRHMVIKRAQDTYGEKLPEVVEKRLDKELNSIIKNGFAVMYIIAQQLVANSVENGYIVGSRGSVGSSFAATMAGITEVNPLPPHYLCGECKYSDFDSEAVKRFAGGCGCDMPDKTCPVCGNVLIKDGHDIPFETFLGFDGDKEPDIDLNFSGEYQQNAHLYAEELFGSKNVFKAGTIGTLADKTAYGYVKKYFEEKGIVKHNAEISRLVAGLTGIKKTTGQHPGGLMVVPRTQDIHNFTPVQRPANDMNSTITTTHFDYHSISGKLLKLDLLGHDDPTVIKMLYDLTGVNPQKVPLDDKDTMDIFTSPNKLGVTKEQIGCETGTLGIPEFGTKFVRQMLMDTNPKSFAELIRISGLSHGTDVWLNNAQEYVRKGDATLKDIISTRDDIMVYLIIMGIEKKTAFDIMEAVRKGRGVSDEYDEIMKSHGVPKWYIESCGKIKYMFPKAHAAAYVMMAFRIAYFKVRYPVAFYTSYFTVRADDFDYTTMCKGEGTLRAAIKELNEKGNSAAAKDKAKLTIMEVALEMYMRGFSFLPLDLYKSDAKKFIAFGDKILPPFNTLPGLGDAAAQSIVEARYDGEFDNVEDLRLRTSVSKTVVELLSQNGILDGIPLTSQLTLV